MARSESDSILIEGKVPDRSASLPQLFPDLDKFLDRSRAGDAIIHHPAASVSGVICLQGGAAAEARQTTPKLVEIVRAHDFVGSNIGTASHGKRIYHIRYLFAKNFCMPPANWEWSIALALGAKSKASDKNVRPTRSMLVGHVPSHRPLATG